MRKKVDFILAFNPLGLPYPDLERYLTIASQVAEKGSKLLLQVPFTNQPKHALLAEWLAECIEGIDKFKTLDQYKVALNLSKFEYDSKLSNDEYIIASYQPDD
jgi:hypothetical protein